MHQCGKTSAGFSFQNFNQHINLTWLFYSLTSYRYWTSCWAPLVLSTTILPSVLKLEKWGTGEKIITKPQKIQTLKRRDQQNSSWATQKPQASLVHACDVLKDFCHCVSLLTGVNPIPIPNLNPSSPEGASNPWQKARAWTSMTQWNGTIAHGMLISNFNPANLY